MTGTARITRGVLALLTVIGFVVWAAAAPATAGTTLTPPANYVALGDSYSSGLGAPPYDLDGICQRSSQSYPSQWAAEHHPASLTFLACSGARTTDVLLRQIPAIPRGTDLVTITIGGNDVGFSPVVQTCTAASSDATCFAAVNVGEIFAVFVLPDLLARTYAAIRQAAPHAQAVVLDYPRLFEQTPGCDDPLAPNRARRTKLNQGADVLDDVIYAVSLRFGFSFADVRGRFDGHGVCSGPNSWINGPSVPTTVGPYHPNPTGYHGGYLPALDMAPARS